MRNITLLAIPALWLSVAGCAPSGSLPKAPLKRGLQTTIEAGPDVHEWSSGREPLFTYWGRMQLEVRCRGRFPGTWRSAGDETWSVEAVTDHGDKVPFMGVVRRYLDIDGKERVEGLPAFDAQTLPAGLYVFIETAVKLSADGSGPAEIRPNAYVMEVRKGGFTPYQKRIALIPDRESSLTPRPEVGPPPHAAVDAKNNSSVGAPLPGWF